MSTLIQGPQLLEIAFGRVVYRAAALLPGTATGNIFTISGGRILVTALFGHAATIAPATTNTLKVSTLPTSGTGADLTTAVSVASKEAGSHVSLTNAVGGALIVGNAGTPPSVIPGFIVNPGAITITTTGTAATGTWDWVLGYLPLDPGAAAAAA